jgi:hypothetical protein
MDLGVLLYPSLTPLVDPCRVIVLDGHRINHGYAMTDKEILNRAEQWDLDHPDPRADEFRDCGVRPVPCDIYKIHRISAASELQGNYIGKSVRLRERWEEHLKMKEGPHKPLYRAFAKHGKENWDYSVLDRKWVYPDLALAKRSLEFAKKELQERTQKWFCQEEVRLGDEWRARIKEGGYSVRLGEESGYHLGEFEPKETVREYCREHKLTYSSYRDLFKRGELPEGFPGDLYDTYREPWSYFTGNTSNQDKEFESKEIVSEYCIENKLTKGSYQNLSKRGELPEGFPGDPHETYREPWSYFTGNAKKETKPVRCKETGTIYASQNECARVMGLHRSSIQQVLLGKLKQTGGYTFESVDQ